MPTKQALIKSPRLDIVAHKNRDGVFDVYKIATGTFIQESSLISCLAGYIVPFHESQVPPPKGGGLEWGDFCPSRQASDLTSLSPQRGLRYAEVFTNTPIGDRSSL